jgi:hypothetical protein
MNLRMERTDEWFIVDIKTSNEDLYVYVPD